LRKHRGVKVVEQVLAPTSVCDFCDAPNPLFAYPVGEIIVGAGEDQTTIPASDWNACFDCHELVVMEDWDGLAVHAGYPAGYPVTPVSVFRRHRLGPPRRLEPAAAADS